MRKETEEKIEALGQRRLLLIEKLAQKPSGLNWCSQHTHLADEILLAIYHDLLQDLDFEPDLAVIATGGFGRSELCPKSDIDITIVPGDESSTVLDSVIRRLFQEIHWAYCTVLRLDVGYAYRLVSDASGLDAKTRTGLMDMRLLAGSQNLYRQLEDTLSASDSAGEFVLAKIEERREMFARYNDTPLVTEPQLKEGAGGLRDFHCASWIGEAIGERAARPTQSYDTVMKYRNLLHYCAKKTNDTLSRARQGEIAEILGISTPTIVKEVSQAGQDLHNSYIRATEKLHEARFTLSPGVVSVGGEIRFLPNSTAGSAAVGVAIATKLDLRVSDLPAKAGSDYAGPSAAYAISTGEKTLRNLDRCSLLAQLLPELTACRNLSDAEGAHTYTVMEHTLRVVRNLDSADSPGFIGDLRSSVVDVEPLYLAAILHDVGKANPHLDHSDAGAKIVSDIGKKWELDSSTVELAQWLVQEHLTTARILRSRDLDHPASIDEYAQIVQDPERLKLLTLLCWADVNAVGPATWTNAQGSMLRQLYERTLLRLQGELLPPPEASQSRQRLLRLLSKKSEESGGTRAYLDSLPAYYLTSTNPEVVRLHMDMVERSKKGDPTIEHHTEQDLAATELTICVLDRPGLLSSLLGVLYAQDLSLLGIRACTTNSSPPVAIDVFTVSFRGRPVPHATMNKTASLLREVLLGDREVEEILRGKNLDPNRRQPVYSWEYLPGLPGILEIRSPRGRGMPFRFSKLFSGQGWNILAARVGQWAGNGTAAFYLNGPDGEVLHKEEIAELLKNNIEAQQLV